MRSLAGIPFENIYMSNNPYNARYGIPANVIALDGKSGLPNKQRVAKPTVWPVIGSSLIGEHMSEFILKVARDEAEIIEKMSLSGGPAAEVFTVLKTWQELRNRLDEGYHAKLEMIYGKPMDWILSTFDTRQQLAEQLGIPDVNNVNRIDTILKSKFSPRGVYSDAINATELIERLTPGKCREMSCYVYIDHEMDDLIALGNIATAFKNVYVHLATDFVDLGKPVKEQRFDFAIRNVLNQELPDNVTLMGEYMCCANVFGAMEHIFEFFDGNQGATPYLLDHLRPLAVARDCRAGECTRMAVKLMKDLLDERSHLSWEQKADKLNQYILGEFRFINPTLTTEQIGQYVPGLFNAHTLSMKNGFDKKELEKLFNTCAAVAPVAV